MVGESDMVEVVVRGWMVRKRGGMEEGGIFVGYRRSR